MSVITNKKVKVELNTDLLKIEYDSTVSEEIRCNISLTGSSGSTVCSVGTVHKMYEELKDFFDTLRENS